MRRYWLPLLLGVIGLAQLAFGVYCFRKVGEVEELATQAPEKPTLQQWNDLEPPREKAADVAARYRRLGWQFTALGSTAILLAVGMVLARRAAGAEPTN